MGIRYDVILKNLLAVIIIVMYSWALFEGVLSPQFKFTAESPGDLRQFMRSCIYCTIPGTLCLLLAFFGVLHSWLNATSELL